MEKRIITALSLYIDFRNLLRAKALTCQLDGNAQAVEVVIIVRKSGSGKWTACRPAPLPTCPYIANLTISTEQRHSGHRCLRLDFDAQQNISFNEVYQYVVLPPMSYLFQVFVKSDRISTDQGVGFHIFDAEAPARFDTGIAAVTGTHVWTRQEVRFVVPSQTRLLRIELRRQPSSKFGNKDYRAHADQGRFPTRPNRHVPGLLK